MPVIDETYEDTCGPTWTAIAGPGRVFIANRASEAALFWSIGTAAPPTLTAGYALPPAHGSRSDTEAVVVPAGRRLWIRSARPASGAAHPVLLTIETAP